MLNIQSSTWHKAGISAYRRNPNVTNKGKKALTASLAFSMCFIMVLSIQSIFAATSVVFSAADAAVPGLSLTIQEETDIPRYVAGGVLLGPTLTSDTLEGTLHLRKMVDYGIEYCNTIDGANQLYSDQINSVGIGDRWVQSVSNDASNTVIKADIQTKSRILIYQVTYQQPPHPQSSATVLIQDNDHPNFVYWIMISGNGYTSASDLENTVNLVIDHCKTLAQRQPQSVTVTPEPEPSSSSTEATREIFVIKACTDGIYVQRQGTGPWIKATVGMELNPYDAIKTDASLLDRVTLGFANRNSTYLEDLSQNYQVDIGGGTTVLLSSQDVSKFSFPKPASTSSGIWQYIEHVYRRTGKVQLPRAVLTTPDGIVSDLQTDFQVIYNASGTFVYAYEGVVTLSDANGANAVEVKQNQMASVKEGGLPSAPSAFDPSSVISWWVNDGSSGTETNKISNIDFEALLNALLPFIVAVIVIVVVIGVARLALSRRKRSGTSKSSSDSAVQEVNINR